MDNILTHYLLKEQHKGNIPEGNFTHTAYLNMVNNLLQHLGPVVHISNIRNRLKTLKGHFSDCKDLFHGLSEFSWNPSSKKFEATSEDHEWRQAITAAGSGCIAALPVERYLVSNNLLVEFHQPQREEVKKELSDRDVQESFDITLTKHKGQYLLRKLYHESPRLICVLYTSPTCGPCRTLKPSISKVIDEFDQSVRFVEIDIEEDPEIAEAAGIVGTPTVQLFRNKDILRAVSGVKMKKGYGELIKVNI